MKNVVSEFFDAEEEQEIALEPLPSFADEKSYLRTVAGLPTPTAEQMNDFVTYVAGAKSWYKHLPVHPPGSPMHFYLDPNAGRDRLRRWGHQVISRDRTEQTQKIHYSWMTTVEYRRRFGYLAFCCPDVTSVFMTEMLDDGNATLDPNVSSPFVEMTPGRLVLVPEAVLEAGACLLTRTVHARTDAASLWKKWNQTANPDHKTEPLRGYWPRIACLCAEMGREAPGIKSVLGLEKELTEIIASQRREDHKAMAFAIGKIVDFVQGTGGGCRAHD
jgi:hypothetical protein